MLDIIRDAPFGQIVRLVTKNKVFQYPEERADFQLPESYTVSQNHHQAVAPLTPSQHSSSSSQLEKEKDPKPQPIPTNPSAHGLAHIKTHHSTASSNLEPITSRDQVSTRLALQRSTTQADLERAYTAATLEKGPAEPIAPTKLDDGSILVDWYDTADPADPKNWGAAKKAFATFLIW